MEKYRLLFESVFKKNLTDDDVVGSLEKLTAEHPYFSVAQFYLLQLSQKDTNAYKQQAKKTAALFNNNYWLNFQLLEAGVKNGGAVYDKPFTPTAADIQENVVEEIVTQEKTEEEIIVPATAAEEPVEINIPAESEIPVEEIKEETAIAAEEETSKTNEPVEIKNISEQEIPVEVIKEEHIIDETIIAAEEPVEINIEPKTKSTEVKTVEAATEKVNPAVEETVVLKDEPLLFEPLHTSDYFASVGIKLSEEESSADKLGKQLKSFTDWLKTMKKMHAGQAAKTIAPAVMVSAATESSIQTLAEKSNQENDVITEAMADVLLQQDRPGKAIEILEKLSLLNPSKSPYFAAKINQIKEK